MTEKSVELRARLTPEQFRVTQEKGTERPFTGAYWDCNDSGVYHCVCCGARLFDSSTKFDTGCGWPSFYRSTGNIVTQEDRSHSMIRTEVLCGQCGAHLGHVFDDGPVPTGLRYCINSASLALEKADDSEAASGKRQTDTQDKTP